MSKPAEPLHDFPFVRPESIRRAVVICHRHADPDSYLSAYALSRLLGRIAPQARVVIALPDGMSTLTQKLAASFPHETVAGAPSPAAADDPGYDLMVAVDIGNTELLQDWKGKLERTTSGVRVLVDHHPLQASALYDRSVVDPSASSAAEVVWRIYGQLKVEPDADAAQALLIAIMFDSQHLAIAGEGALRAVLGLLERGATLDGARASLRSPPDYGEVVAKLKAAKRMKFYRVGGWVVATSTVGSFQANVARALVSLGADVAIVAGEVGEETRGSLRANQRFREATNVHLGTDVAEAIGRKSGYGGGHATAASFTCGKEISEEAAVERALRILADLLKGTPAEIK